MSASSPFFGFDETPTGGATGDKSEVAVTTNSKSNVGKRSVVSRRSIELQKEASARLALIEIEELNRISEADEEARQRRIDIAARRAKIESDELKRNLKLEQMALKSERSSECSRSLVDEDKESVSSSIRQKFTSEWLERQRKMNVGLIDVNDRGNQDTPKFQNKPEIVVKRFRNIQQTPVRSGYSIQRERENIIETPRAKPEVSHFIARQSFNRELPYFNGDPMEWPMFFSCFTETSSACNYSDAENMCRLQKCLKGAAKDAVSTLLIQPQNASKVIETLKFRFGRPEQIIYQLVEKVKQLKSPREDKLETLMIFATAVQNLSEMLLNLDSTPHLMNPQLLSELVSKLPPSLQLRWGETLLNYGDTHIQIDDFSDWLMEIAKASSLVVRPSTSTVVVNKSSGFNQKKFPHNENSKKYPVFTHVESSKNPVKKETEVQCSCCESRDHKIDNCKDFKDRSIEERWEFVKKNRLCFDCLVKSHRAINCKAKKKCGVENCKKLHHYMLHYTVKEKSPDYACDEDVEIQTNCHTIPMNGKEKILFKIVPVKLFGPTGSVDTYAFLDDGSSVTLMEDSIARRIGFNGET